MITSEIKNAYKIKQLSLTLCNASNPKKFNAQFVAVFKAKLIFRFPIPNSS